MEVRVPIIPGILPKPLDNSGGGDEIGVRCPSRDVMNVEGMNASSPS